MSDRSSAPLLIIDDDAMIRSALERLLRNDFQLELVADVASARESIHNTQFEMALIDLHLNGGTSLDFLRELQLKSPTTARILISGALDLDRLVESVDTSLVHKVLHKPWDPATLVLQIKEARQIHQLLVEKHRLEELSTTDALTGLFNYRYLQDLLPKEIERAKRQSRNLSIIMIDVDGFKQMNDSRGHIAGDEVLKQIGALLKNGLRSFDVLARYGGDEFCIVLQETDLKLAVEIAERLRKRVQQEGTLTLSLGLSSFPEVSADATQLLADADTALYTAKNRGRNCSVIAAPAGRG